MTVNGEVMVEPPKDQPSNSTVRWIVPDGRLTKELGMRITKYAGRVTLDKGPLKNNTIEAVIINSLPCLTWDDFKPIRNMLANSHLTGRTPWHGDKNKQRD